MRRRRCSSPPHFARHLDRPPPLALSHLSSHSRIAEPLFSPGRAHPLSDLQKDPDKMMEKLAETVENDLAVAG